MKDAITFGYEVAEMKLGTFICDGDMVYSVSNQTMAVNYCICFNHVDRKNGFISIRPVWQNNSLDAAHVIDRNRINSEPARQDETRFMGMMLKEQKSQRKD